VTDATTAFTVMAADPVLPSLVAVTVAGPALTPVTRPVVDTVATVGVPEVHVTTRPVSTFPAASFVVAASCTVLLTATLADAGATVTDATAAVTVMAATADVPSRAVMTVAAPAPTPVPSAGLVPSVHRSCAIPLTLVRAAPANTLPPPLVTRKFTSCPLCGSPFAFTTFTTSGFGSSLPGGPDWRSPLTTCTDTGALGCNG